MWNLKFYSFFCATCSKRIYDSISSRKLIPLVFRNVALETVRSNFSLSTTLFMTCLRNKVSSSYSFGHNSAVSITGEWCTLTSYAMNSNTKSYIRGPFILSYLIHKCRLMKQILVIWVLFWRVLTSKLLNIGEDCRKLWFSNLLLWKPYIISNNRISCMESCLKLSVRNGLSRLLK